MTPRDEHRARRLERLAAGTVIPALPLALTETGEFSERHQRAVNRYYLAAGAGGVAVAVHSTQFEIREQRHDLLKPVLESSVGVAAEHDTVAETSPILIAGACGPVTQAVSEAAMAADLGYDAVLLSPGNLDDHSETDLIERAERVGEIIPVIGFYLQESVGGRYFSPDFWRRLADLDSTIAIKIAPFDRYRTLDVVRAVESSSRRDSVALYTGNDDTIVTDLITHFPGARGRTRRMVGGLLGQFAVWTSRAVEILDDVHAADSGDTTARIRLEDLGPKLTDANGAIFDVRHGFAGCIPGINEVLRRQGLLPSARTLNPDQVLSPGQADELDRICSEYPELQDNDFVSEHRDRWLD